MGMGVTLDVQLNQDIPVLGVQLRLLTHAQRYVAMVKILVLMDAMMGILLMEMDALVHVL